MPATKTRKAKELVATWEPSSLVGPLWGLLALDDGKTESQYAVCEVRGDSPRCFEVQKLDGSEPYMVKVTHGGQAIGCDCWGTCGTATAGTRTRSAGWWRKAKSNGSLTW
jgi:hypothetical protein